MRLCAELFSLVLLSKGMGEDSRNLKFRENFRGRVVSCVGRLVPKGTFENSSGTRLLPEKFLELWVFVIALLQ
jgi:hypothetical protein